MTLMISENSMKDRLDKTRGFGNINQLQTLHVVTKSPLQLNMHDRIYTEGATNRGNVVGPLALDAYDNADATWSLKTKEKFALFGRHGPRIPVGDRGPDNDDEAGEISVPNKGKQRDKDVEEPFLFHTVPSTMFEELIHGLDTVAVIALASDGKAAMVALERRLPFFGITFTEDHSHWLVKRLEGQVFRRYQDSKSKLWTPALTTLIGTNKEVDDPKVSKKKGTGEQGCHVSEQGTSASCKRKLLLGASHPPNNKIRRFKISGTPGIPGPR
jgi:hypothetical protein